MVTWPGQVRRACTVFFRGRGAHSVRGRGALLQEQSCFFCFGGRGRARGGVVARDLGGGPWGGGAGFSVPEDGQAGRKMEAGTCREATTKTRSGTRGRAREK
jgi:hypothetical protein